MLPMIVSCSNNVQVSMFSTFFLLASPLDERDVAASTELLARLETIDDDLDRHGVALVKMSDSSAAAEYGIDRPPAVVYFENGIPSLCREPLDSAEGVLGWLVQQVEGDEIEDVTDEMLQKILGGDHGTAIIFCEYHDSHPYCM